MFGIPAHHFLLILFLETLPSFMYIYRMGNMQILVYTLHGKYAKWHTIDRDL